MHEKKVQVGISARVDSDQHVHPTLSYQIVQVTCEQCRSGYKLYLFSWTCLINEDDRSSIGVKYYLSEAGNIFRIESFRPNESHTINIAQMQTHYDSSRSDALLRNSVEKGEFVHNNEHFFLLPQIFQNLPIHILCEIEQYNIDDACESYG